MNFTVITDTIDRWSSLGVGPAEVQQWPLMNLQHCLLVTLMYYVVVFILTQIMKNKKEPLELKVYSQLHNVCMVAISLYMGLEYLRLIFHDNLKLYNNKIGSGPEYLPHARIQWIFYLSKIPEWNDTFIMIMKKNFRQVSVLHLYHHGSIFVFSYMGTRFIPGGDCWLAAFINSWVHVVMYSYYFCAPLAKNPNPNIFVKMIVKMKMFITMGQLIQFLIVFSRDCFVLYDHYINGRPWCHQCGPEFMYWSELFYMTTMVALFLNFFIKSYTPRRPSA
ncbi:elongation of very long chain fatty acids protein, partial [Acrasis kona]